MNEKANSCLCVTPKKLYLQFWVKYKPVYFSWTALKQRYLFSLHKELTPVTVKSRHLESF
jgi:hypothetical protein